MFPLAKWRLTAEARKPLCVASPSDEWHFKQWVQVRVPRMFAGMCGTFVCALHGCFCLQELDVRLKRRAVRAARSTQIMCTPRALCHYAQKLDVRLKGVSLVLCNDKQSSFGAPDVLQACADPVVLVYKVDTM